jgi:hypothetical protein
MRLVVLVGVVLLCGLGRRVDACSPNLPAPLVLDPNEQTLDTTPPWPAVVTAVDVSRGDSWEGACSHGCGDLGEVILTLGQSGDDRTDADRLGYLLEVSSGTSGEIDIPAEPVTAWRGVIGLPWLDGYGDQEPIAFTLRVTTVDRGGNRGTPIEVFISDGGSGGCRVGRHGATPWAVGFLSVCLLLGLKRRRK